MDKINEIFDKLIYGSEDYISMQKTVDGKLQSIIKKAPDIGTEQLSDDLNEVVLDAEKQAFALGMKYGLRLLREMQDIDE